MNDEEIYSNKSIPDVEMDEVDKAFYLLAKGYPVQEKDWEKLAKKIRENEEDMEQVDSREKIDLIV